MGFFRFIVFSGLLLLSFNSFAEEKGDEEKEVIVKIETSFGDIKIKLYNETPKHRDNFIKLVGEGYYNGTLFHRVIKDFMIQGGDPNSKNAVKGQILGEGSPGYMIDAEIDSNLIHKKGALAAARQGDNVNPEKKSSGSQFYLVQGRKFTDEELDKLEAQRKQNLRNQIFNNILNQPENARLKKMVDGYLKVGNQRELQFVMGSLQPAVEAEVLKRGEPVFTTEQRNIYKEEGGAPHLDYNYTVFGEVISGLNVIDKIAALETNAQNRPLEDVVVKMKIVKK